MFIQCAVRCHFAKKRADKRRSIVCKAVLLQSAWRSFIARKEFVMKKQAAILLQAHWRGQSARKWFVVLLEEQKRQKAEQAKLVEKKEVLKKEEMTQAEALRKEQEEVKKQGEHNLFSL